MTERRNFYRLLSVQPDAPLSVIQATHRVLMQNLHQLADQEFAEKQACLLNTALSVLEDPIKRAVYDRQLRKHFPIKQLSLGAFAPGIVNNFTRPANAPYVKNQRNYYRILQIQPDASLPVIIASYSALIKYPFQNIELLDEAYAVLANPAVRIRYDAFLTGSRSIHIQDNARDREQSKPLLTAFSVSSGIEAPANPVHEPATHTIIQSQASASLRHCVFCYTAFANQLAVYQSNHCPQCNSPLPDEHDRPVKLKQRAHRRLDADGLLDFYLFWPDTPYQATLQNLSPSGLRFLTEASLDTGDTIKIDAPNFKAVAEVAHIQHIEGNRKAVGARFLAIQFTHERGNFVVARA